MKSKIRKISAKILAICSMMGTSFTAFCAGGSERTKRLYSKDDYWALENVIKKVRREEEKYRRYNSAPNKGDTYFSGMSTYAVGSNSVFKPLTFDELYDEIGYDCNVDTIVYKPGSFNIGLFCRIVDMNNVRGTAESIEPLDLEKDYKFPMSIVKNGFKYILENRNTGKTIEFDFVFGKTLPPQGERNSLKNSIKAYNQFVDVFYSAELYNPYEIDLCKVDENDVNSDVVSDIIAANGWFIPRECLKNCRFVKTLLMPQARIIYEEAFENCTNLKTVNIPKVTDIGEKAFYRCKNLKTISMPNVKIIDAGAFEGCENLESVYIPKVEYISVNAFKGCKNLKVIDIPKSTRVLNSNAFNDCNSDLRIIYGGTIYKSIDQFIENLNKEE